MLRHGWPRARAGERIGLLGGSFDPAHAGHAAITEQALKRFALDRVWWLVSPGNPLKANPPAPLDDRMARARQVIRHPRVVVTDLERRLGTRYTADTIRALTLGYPGVRFVWLMGADNLATVHEWDHWRRIFGRVPVGILARPGERSRAKRSPAARVFVAQRVPGALSRALPDRPPPAWCYVDIPLREESSTALRRAGAWRRTGA